MKQTQEQKRGDTYGTPSQPVYGRKLTQAQNSKPSGTVKQGRRPMFKPFDQEGRDQEFGPNWKQHFPSEQAQQPQAADHSPLPWKQRQPDGGYHTTDIVDSHGNLIANVQSIPYRTTGRADAKLIVASVNHADKLAEALRELDMAHNHKTLCQAKERARQAIAAYEKDIR